MKRNRLMVMMLALVIGLASTAMTSAEVLVYDGFSGYTLNASVVGQDPTTTGFTGAWSNTGGALAAAVNYFPRADNLTYPAYTPNSDGSLEAFRSSGSHSGGSKRVSRDFDYAAPGTDDFYISFLIENDSTSAEANTRIRLQGLTTEDGNRDTFFDIDHATNTLEFEAGGGSGLDFNEGLSTGANLIVIRAIYDFGIDTAGNPNQAFYDVIQVWVNPTITPSATPSFADLGTPDATGFGIMRSFNGSGTPMAFDSIHFLHELNSGSVSLDEFMITNDIADFTFAIPEPTSAALLGLAGIVLLRRRRQMMA